METEKKHELKHNTECRTQSLEFFSLSHLVSWAPSQKWEKNGEKTKKLFMFSA